MGFRQNLKENYLSLTDTKWAIGIMDYDEEFVLNPDVKPRVRWINTKNKEGWYADPFILSVSGGKMKILVESFNYKRNKAGIALLDVDIEKAEVIEATQILSSSTHMSFPAYFRKDGYVYMYPENVKSGALYMYRFDEGNNSIERIQTIIEAPLADAVICRINGKSVLTGTLYPNDNGRHFVGYSYDDNTGIASPDPLFNVVLPDKSARNAGMLLSVGDRLIRPAQNSNHFYGECLVFQELVSEGNAVSFKEIKRVYSPNRMYPLSFHTFNVLDGYAVVDALGFRCGFFGEALYRIRERFRK